MVEILVTSTHVSFEITGWDIILALKKSLTVPLDGIAAVYADPYPYRPWEADRLKWIRLGSSIPGVVQAGTLTGPSAREFWCIHYTGNAVVFELKGFPYTRVVVDVREPEAVVQRVWAARLAQA